MSNATAARRVRVEKGIYRRPDGRLEIGWRDASGKLRWRAMKDRIVKGRLDRATLTEARAELTRELARRANGEAVAADPRLTFNAAADAWWEGHVLTRMRPTTQSAYRADLKHLRAAFGTRRIATIGPGDVAAYVASKRDLKGWTVKGQVSTLSAIFRFSIRHLGVAVPNPVSLLDPMERPKTDDEKPKRILNRSELDRLLAAVDARHRLIFRVAAETGCRLGEVLGLAWENIDVKAQTVTFTAQLDRQGRRVPLKTTRSRRVLEVTPGLAAELGKHKLASEWTAPGDLVFTGRSGRGHDHRNIGGRVLARAAKNAELVPAPTFHDLRHSHASALIAAGEDIETVSSRLGHADIATTQRVYVHAFDAANRSDERRAVLSRLYGNVMETTGRSSTQQTSPAEIAEGPELQAVAGER